MSPYQAMERSYAALRDMLRQGTFPPGHRLEANRIANEIGVSMTPVRDALNRLVGEQMVEASRGDGFHVPRLSERDLRDLYEWNSALVTVAARTARTLPSPEAVSEALDQESVAAAAEACFSLIARSAPNRELRAAIARTSDRLHSFRRVEDLVLMPQRAELESLFALSPRQQSAIRRYHVGRMRAVSEILSGRADL